VETLFRSRLGVRSLRSSSFVTPRHQNPFSP
jgi:hypothetical protein